MQPAAALLVLLLLQVSHGVAKISWHMHCRAGYMQCPYQKLCVPPRFQCDGYLDCLYSELDETDCLECAAGAFLCDGTRCVADRYRCDGVEQCRDGTDEQDCEELQHRINCTTTLNSDIKCDGVLDCPDGMLDYDDEFDCQECQRGAFLCVTPGLGQFCLRLEMVCDGEPDCPDGSDEYECTATADGHLWPKERPSRSATSTAPSAPDLTRSTLLLANLLMTALVRPVPFMFHRNFRSTYFT